MDESNIDTKALEQNQPTSPGSQEDSENKQEPEEYTSITYSLALEKIQQSIKDPEVLISLMDMIAKEFFRKKFHINSNLEYAEMVSIFLEKNKPEIATFCYKMAETLYGGESKNFDKLWLVLEDLRIIIEKEQGLPPAREEPSIKGIFSPFAKAMQAIRNKKPHKEKRSLFFIEKKTKKAIDEELYNAKSEAESEQIQKKEDQSLPRVSILQEQDPATYEYLESIDNLERIKQKIWQRKRSGQKQPAS